MLTMNYNRFSSKKHALGCIFEKSRNLLLRRMSVDTETLERNILNVKNYGREENGRVEAEVITVGEIRRPDL